ncbi:pleckstrin homology domain-containing family G member 1 isoform X1 [Polypterus senegalus]|uniref:pleckstrin homology domain-containing family G member 1 isoform X1 n=2 Tax=Polypterus senegalus TaxID=55291 RepID=UPI001965EAA0|nr:pleckstrin homology domain-containing family G member 1 isoform X1 [Polypterus senegalus]
MPTDDYVLQPDSLPTVPEFPDKRTPLNVMPLGRFNPEKRAFQYCAVRSMDSSDNDRPVSYSSTSSSASSRDSHCSLGSRATLVSSSHLGLGPTPSQEKDAGAIRLELIPAQQLGCHRERENQVNGSFVDKRSSTLKRVDSKGASPLPSLEPTNPKMLYVDRVVQEILDTERTYVEDLRSIVQDYLDCITDHGRLSLGTEERAALFGNIREIYHFNSDLLQDLENCKADPVAIAECFVAKSEDFHIYTQYCTNYPSSVAVLTDCMRNKALAKFFRDRQEALQHCLPLGSYLLKPVQRILKYHLLLQEIAAHLDKDTEAYEVVQDAIETMQRVAWHINDMKRKHEHAVRLQEIQSLLANWKGPDLISYGELVLEGTFRIQRAKNERTLFLFDKLLLITKKREEIFTYKAHILCCNLMLVEVIPKEPLSFSVFHYKNPKLQHTVQAKSQQDKRLWILHLKRLILENHPAKIPAKAKQAILEMDAAHHPGFHYSPEGERKATSDSKENSATLRIRRKSEPSSRSRAVKQNEKSSEAQKRISIEGSLLSPTAKLGSAEVLLTSCNRENVLESSSPVNQSQESLDPAYPNDFDESLHMHAAEQVDEDDEDDAEQASKESLLKDAACLKRSVNAISSTLQPTRLSASSNHSNLNNMLGGAQAIRRIWTDHQIRQALFPRRQPERCTEEEEDVYQMFLPSASDSQLNVTRSKEQHQGSGRPCSWHVSQPLPETPRLNCVSVRRASSVRERNLDQKSSSSCGGIRQRDVVISQTSDIPGRRSLSTEQLTVDDIENVYDNISYEDLKEMGLLRRQHNDSHVPQKAAVDKTGSCLGSKEKPVSSFGAAGITNVNLPLDVCKSKGSGNFGPCELKIVEENIYDTIGFPDQSVESYKEDLDLSKRDSFILLETDLSCDGLSRFISDESLQFSEDDASDHRVPAGQDYLGWIGSSSNSDSLSHRLVADKLSEEVDEIWNDLENYIKKNEKKQDRLPAAFPVSRHDMPGMAFSKVTPTERPASAFSQTEIPVLKKCVGSKSMRLGGSNLKLEGDTLKDRSLINLSRLSHSGDLGNHRRPQSAVLSKDMPDFSGPSGDLMDKTKNRVFMMARQYSQKIKKANQLLKMKSPEQDHPPSKQKQRQKDLAAILEEKKQGGPAIGARIAEYSQLYEQIMFREAHPCAQTSESSHRHLQFAPDGHLISEDWLTSTYSNGELADFVSWPDEAELQTKDRLASTPHRLSSACSVPTLKSCTPHSPSQRWSTFVSQPNKENLSQEHIYNSLGRRPVSSKLEPYSRCQSSSSVMVNCRTMESSSYQTRRDYSLGASQAQMGAGKSCDLLMNQGNEPPKRGEEQLDVNEQHVELGSGMILQDSQKVLVVNRNSPLNAHVASQNYFANFKDTGDNDDDDEDYVEIKSEDEEQDQALDELDGVTPGLKEHSSQSLSQSLSSPCTPLKMLGSQRRPVTLTTFTAQDKLNDYLWSVPPENQQNIVQSLREKFQCLSSSSFA